MNTKYVTALLGAASLLVGSNFCDGQQAAAVGATARANTGAAVKSETTTVTPTPANPTIPNNPGAPTGTIAPTAQVGTVQTSPTPVTTVNPVTAPFPLANATTPGAPVITGTVSGLNGKTYFVGQNGFLYFRGADGALHEFGKFLPNVNETAVNQGALPQTQTQPLAQPQQPLVQPQQPLTVNAVTNSVVPTGTSPLTLPGTSTPTGTTPLAGAVTGTATATGLPSSASGTGSVQITGTVVGNDGKTFFVGANGFLYYRGQDGALHIFGSGQPE